MTIFSFGVYEVNYSMSIAVAKCMNGRACGGNVWEYKYLMKRPWRMFHLHLLAERIMSNIYSLSPLYTIHIYIIQYRQSDNTPEYKYKSNIRLYLVEDMANAKRLLDGAPTRYFRVPFVPACFSPVFSVPGHSSSLGALSLFVPFLFVPFQFTHFLNKIRFNYI
jgi:hypothetical protein